MAFRINQHQIKAKGEQIVQSRIRTPELHSKKIHLYSPTLSKMSEKRSTSSTKNMKNDTESDILMYNVEEISIVKESESFISSKIEFSINEKLSFPFHDIRLEEAQKKTEEKLASSFKTPKNTENSTLSIVESQKFEKALENEENGFQKLHQENETKTDYKRMKELDERIKRGAKIFERLPIEKQTVIRELSKYFDSWENAYSGSLKVYEIMKMDDTFDLYALVSQLMMTFGRYLVCAIEALSKNSSMK